MTFSGIEVGIIIAIFGLLLMFTANFDAIKKFFRLKKFKRRIDKRLEDFQAICDKRLEELNEKFKEGNKSLDKIKEQAAVLKKFTDYEIRIVNIKETFSTYHEKLMTTSRRRRRL